MRKDARGQTYVLARCWVHGLTTKVEVSELETGTLPPVPRCPGGDQAEYVPFGIVPDPFAPLSAEA